MLELNASNQFAGKVIGIRSGDVVSEVELQTAAGVISAVVTTASLERLKLHIGDDAVAVFKATDVLVGKL
ncbi:MAG: TOBE domain-containing protein [Gammaproteobacteria bacterium]|nr:TOBE domain-containing protein [Gammaproteobacteria bacterium]